MLKKLSLIALCSASAFALHTAEININDKDLELGARLDMGQFNEATEPNTVFVGAKFLKGDAEHSDFSENSIKDFYELNFLMQREIAGNGLSIGLGVKINHTKDFTSIPLGIEAAYKLPASNTVPLYFGAGVYYAPEVLSMEDGNNFLEYRAHVDIEVIENGRITVGYRALDTNYEDSAGSSIKVNYNRSAYAGFKFAF
ncbi:hypothetical protein KJ877_04425 [bacterium]|nr:hypothetical protein [bacterium]MBU1991053.1 hypothetical protein [bacterium]